MAATGAPPAPNAPPPDVLEKTTMQFAQLSAEARIGAAPIDGALLGRTIICLLDQSGRVPVGKPG